MSFSLRCNCAIRLRIEAWAETSRRDVGSSRTMNFGFNARARAMATCWRWPALISWGNRGPAIAGKPDKVKKLSHLFLYVSAGPASVDEGLSDDPPYAHPRVESEGIGILEDRLDVRPVAIEGSTVKVGHLLLIEEDLPCGRLIEFEEYLPYGGL